MPVLVFVTPTCYLVNCKIFVTCLRSAARSGASKAGAKDEDREREGKSMNSAGFAASERKASMRERPRFCNLPPTIAFNQGQTNCRNLIAASEGSTAKS